MRLDSLAVVCCILFSEVPPPPKVTQHSKAQTERTDGNVPHKSDQRNLSKLSFTSILSLSMLSSCRMDFITNSPLSTYPPTYLPTYVPTYLSPSLPSSFHPFLHPFLPNPPTPAPQTNNYHYPTQLSSSLTPSHSLTHTTQSLYPHSLTHPALFLIRGERYHTEGY